MDDPGTELSATFQGWSRLPDELKVQILAHNLDQKDGIKPSEHDPIFADQLMSTIGTRDPMDGIKSTAHTRVFAEQLTSIIGTRNRELTTLALETYYTRNVFKVTIDIRFPSHRTYIQHPPPAYGHLIRRMEVLVYTCYMYMMTPRLLLQKSSTMRHILSPSPKSPLGGDVALNLFALLPHEYSVSTLWQANFMHLQSLAFRFEYPAQKEIALFIRPGECDHCGLAPFQVERVLTAVQGMHIALQAAKTTVVFTSTCPCLTRLAQLLARMATKSDK